MSDRYAVVGNPVAHSRSPQIHALFARATGQDIEYGRLLAPLDGFAAAVANFAAEGGRGLNVTLPFKGQAFELSTRRTPRAEAAGAVNTLSFEGGQVLGDNTDGIGLVRDIENRVGLSLSGRSLLLIGAGGAAGGVVRPLLDAGLARLAIANRSPERALELARRSKDARVQGGGFELVVDALADGQRFDAIVNATASGLAGERLPLPDAVFAGAGLALDMFYAPRATPFMAQAGAAGCPRCCDGLGMLVEQAAESFFVWRGLRPDTAPVYAALRAELAASAC
ncbi:MAG: shikimate dehydrogenase [Limnobacter sp.]|nr:shikimate dehydrogenase [Limnobacter sp.]